MDDEHEANLKHAEHSAQAIADLAVTLTNLMMRDRYGMGKAIVPFRGAKALVIVATDADVCEILMQTLEYIDRYEIAGTETTQVRAKLKCPSDVM